MCASEQSDRPIVPEKLSNKALSIPIKSGPRGCGDGGGKGADQGEPVKVQSRLGRDFMGLIYLTIWPKFLSEPGIQVDIIGSNGPGSNPSSI